MPLQVPRVLSARSNRSSYSAFDENSNDPPTEEQLLRDALAQGRFTSSRSSVPGVVKSSTTTPAGDQTAATGWSIVAGPGGAAAVVAEAAARAAADGFLESKYTLKVITGNIVTGMNITSSTGSGTDISDITFQATTFKVHNGVTGKTPFVISGTKLALTGDVEIDGSLVLTGTISLIDLTNKSLANLDSTANTKLGGIATGATVGATWGSNITGQPTDLSGLDAVANAKLAGISAGADVTLSAINGLLAVTGGGLVLSSTAMIRAGQTAYDTGTGFFLGLSSGTPKFSIGAAGGQGLKWDGTNLTINGSITLQNTIAAGSVTGLAGVATSGTLAAGSVTGLAATATSSDFASVTGTTKPANNADVTLSAINGDLYVTGGGINLAGGRIQSSNYSAGTTGWKINYDGSAEFQNVTIRGTLNASDITAGTITASRLPTSVLNAALGSYSSGGTRSSTSYGALTTGSPLEVTVTCDGNLRKVVYSSAYLANATGSTATCYLALYMDGSTLISEFGGSSGVSLASSQQIPCEFTGLVTPSAGSHSFQLYVKSSAGGSTATGGTIYVE